ncbi:MAG: hypothetical protein M0R74_12315 [Dehalococcoidia bacterium]|nr:hypothetical protein [Dehalococcoidia bacterium]
MAGVELPPHVVIQRRDGRREILLHRSMAVIGDDKMEIKAARGLVIIPIIGLAISLLAGMWMANSQGSAPLWVLVLGLLALLFLVPVSVMSLVSAFAGADVVIDRKKNSATWQQGYLGMGIGTRELVPFHKIGYLEIHVEGDEEDRWQGESDDLRQFALWLVKTNGKRLKLAQVPVPASDQGDGMDRTLAVAHAAAAITGAEVRLPEGWELVEIDTETGDIVKEPPAQSQTEPNSPGEAHAKAPPAKQRRPRGQHRH